MRLTERVLCSPSGVFVHFWLYQDEYLFLFCFFDRNWLIGVRWHCRRKFSLRFFLDFVVPTNRSSSSWFLPSLFLFVSFDSDKLCRPNSYFLLLFSPSCFYFTSTLLFNQHLSQTVVNNGRTISVPNNSISTNVSHRRNSPVDSANDSLRPNSPVVSANVWHLQNSPRAWVNDLHQRNSHPA